MRTQVVPDNWIERLALWLGLAPTPMVDTFQALVLARAVMAACKLGIFESLAQSPAAAKQVAERNHLDRYGTEKLLGALVTAGYLRYRRGQYALTRKAKKWMVPASPCSLHDNMLLRYLEWQALDQLEHFVSTGQAIDAHDILPDDAWETYQRGLAALARLSAKEIAGHLRLPRGSTAMLDVGGAHGRYAMAVCQRFPQLQATVLELPEAVASAERVFRDSCFGHEDVAHRITYRGGNALTDPWEDGQWDLIFASHLIHHFSAAENQSFVVRAARSLRPGGILAIVDAARPEIPNYRSQTGHVLDLFFAITSRSGTWSVPEVREWQSAAGLTWCPVRRLRTMPGVVMWMAEKQQIAGPSVSDGRGVVLDAAPRTGPRR